MSYRNITVDGIQYKYVTGKTHTKVVDIGVVKNEEIGSYHWYGISPCGSDCKCSCDPYEEILNLRVTPSDVAIYIKYKNKYKEGFLPINERPANYKIGDVRKIDHHDWVW